MAAATLAPCGRVSHEVQRGACMRALAPRDSFSTRLLCFGKVLFYIPKRRAAKFKTGVEDLVSYSNCAHTKFEGKLAVAITAHAVPWHSVLSQVVCSL